MGLVPLTTPAHVTTKRRSSPVFVAQASAPSSPRSPTLRLRTLCAAATPPSVSDEPPASPVTRTGSIFSATREELADAFTTQMLKEASPEADDSPMHPEQPIPDEHDLPQLMAWDRLWLGTNHRSMGSANIDVVNSSTEMLQTTTLGDHSGLVGLQKDSDVVLPTYNVPVTDVPGEADMQDMETSENRRSEKKWLVGISCFALGTASMIVLGKTVGFPRKAN